MTGLDIKNILASHPNIPFEIDDKIIKKLDNFLSTKSLELTNSKKIIIYGSPKAWKRHRASRISGMYDPNTPEKRVIQSYFEEEFGQEISMIQGEIQMFIKAYRPIPKSLPKPIALLYEAEILRPLGRPDVDNFIKLIQDALNGITYRDDAQITKIVSEKYLSYTPRTEIIMTWADQPFV